VHSESWPSAGLSRFATSPYKFFSVVLRAKEVFSRRDLDGCTLFCLESDTGASVRIEDAAISLTAGGSASIENGVSLAAAKGGVRLLVSGAPRAQKRFDSISITPGGRHYKVAKPWGHELWINGSDPDFSFKEAFITAGNQTSLQYHALKRETNVVVRGVADVVYKAQDDVDNDRVKADHLASLRCEALTIIDVSPRKLHRIVAVSDVLIHEVSTPHLDDVIRVQDDFGRSHGRIGAEHAGNASGAAGEASSSAHPPLK
jgi:hypothetical protein